MPYLKITTSKPIDAEPKLKLLKAASKTIAAELGKPEQYMMVSAETPVSMLFGGSDAPCAFLELRGIGLPISRTEKLSQVLCALVESHAGIPQAGSTSISPMSPPTSGAGTARPSEQSQRDVDFSQISRRVEPPVPGY